MALKPGKPETQPEVEVIPSSEKPQQPAEVILDATTGKPVVEAPAPAPASISAEELRKMEARWEFQRRQDRKEFLDTLAKMQQAPARPAEKSSDVDEFGPDLDSIAQADWKKGVSVVADKIAEKRVRAILAEERKQQLEESSKNQLHTILEREKQWVVSQNPSLDDETSEEYQGYFKTYKQMLSEDPTLVSNPRAPRLVYREWKASEEKPSSPTVNLEAERLKRVAAGSTLTSRNISQPKTIKLTQDELDLCERKGISPQTFAKMKDANFKEGVSA